MSDNSDTKKRKSNDLVGDVDCGGDGTLLPNKKKTLFVLESNAMNDPMADTHYAVFTSSVNVEVYDLLCKQLYIDMKSAARGWHDVIDAERVWVPWMMFLTYASKYDAVKHSGYKSEEDYQKSRNQKARIVMQLIGMINNMEDFLSDSVGKDFIKEEIGEFKIVSKRDVMAIDGFSSVMIVPDNCNRECKKYYNKL